MTRGAATAAGVRLIVWCKACQHQVEPNPAEIAARYGADTPVLDWRERRVCSRVSGPAGSDHRRETFGRLRHLRQIGLAPQVTALKSRKDPASFKPRYEISYGRPKPSEMGCGLGSEVIKPGPAGRRLVF
jgi:hypothetical protein